MARAKRHYIPGHIWHITHRCHKREFLLKFAKDRQSWRYWLFTAKKRYHLVILNYMVTSNHIHLLVADDADRDAIPKSMQLVAGSTGQEYNVRKNRKGAFWEDRYHATAIESGDHLLKCIAYIDLNMVRAGVVNHPSDWEFSGYNEIQNPRRKCALIAYDRLRALLNFSTYEGFVTSHRQWVENALKNHRNRERDSKWTESIAVGSKEFTETTKHQLGIRAKGRKIIESRGICELRESESAYLVNFTPKNSDIDINNAYFWNAIAESSG
jgi:putative transposase